MTDKYQNKYRIPSARLQNWDYRWAGAYFITICTQNRECLFGEVENGQMKLSPVGIIADVLWYEIKKKKKNIELDAFVVMPNHVHGILILNGNCENDINILDDVETGHALSLQPEKQPQQTIGQKRFQNIGKNSVSSIIGSYKSSVTKHAHRLGYNFAWQPRFHDIIIRDNDSFIKIQTYIIENPIKWGDDKI